MNTDINNPFVTRESDMADKTPFDKTNSGEIRKLMEPLIRTRPWALLVSIICLMISFYFLFVSVLVIVKLSTTLEHIDLQIFFSLIFFQIGVYLFGLIVSTILSWQLFQYAKAIKHYHVSNQLSDLKQVLKSQSNFWKILGISLLVFLAYLLIRDLIVLYF